MNKRITAAVVAALTFAAPLASTAAYADPPRYSNRAQNENRGNDARRGDNRDQRFSDNRGRDQRFGDNRRDQRFGDNRRDQRFSDNRRDQRWDDRRDNGYWYNGRWYFGRPSAAYFGRPGFQPGYHAWRRGERLPSFYRAQFRQVDFRREHLRAPPRGYHYVRDNRGDILLVGVATGVILSIILAGN